MRKPLLRLGGMMLVVFTLLAIPASQARAGFVAPLCYDLITQQYLPATKWLDSPGTLTGTNKRDVLVGSTGGDVINGLGGNDVICTTPNGDQDFDIDVVKGGAGNDSIYGIAHASGGTGNDFIFVVWTGSTADGGPGSDTVLGTSGAKVNGGSGNDVVAGIGASDMWGGSGNDALGIIYGYQDSKLDCGSGTDSYAIDDNGIATTRRCEKTDHICPFYFAWDWNYFAGNPNTPDPSAFEATDVHAQC